MILSEQEIKKICLNKHPDYLNNVKYEETLNLIINGHKFIKYLIGLSKLENKKQEELKKLYAKSTKGLAWNILKPFQNIFTAVGGTKDYIFSGKNNLAKGNSKTQRTKELELKQKMIESPMNGTTDVFMSNIWGQRVLDSSRSTILMEVSKDGNYIYPVFISQSNVTNWKYKGYLDYDYIVIFEGCYYLGKNEVKVFRVIDEKIDYTVIVDQKDECIIVGINESIVLQDNEENNIEFKSITHNFGQVPAMQMTTKLSYDMSNKISLIDPAIENFKEQLLDDSIKRSYKFLHGYPYFVGFDNDVCSSCGGIGKDRLTGETCGICGGTGIKKKDVSDKQSIDIPEKEEHLITPSNWAAYIAPSIETWKQINEDLTENATVIMQTLWGVDITEGDKQYSTLGARILDLKPKSDRLSEYSNIAQIIDKKITDYIGNFYFPGKFEESIVLYGNFYLTNTPEDLLATYQELKKNGANYDELDKAIMNYYYTLYAKKPQEIIIKKRDLDYEPFYHENIETVEGFNISDIIKKRKSYFHLYLQTISNEQYLGFNDLNFFNVELDKFIASYDVESQ